MTFCPMTKENCRDDCAWADICYDIDSNGIDREVSCAIAIIAAKLLMEDEDEGDYID